MRDAGVREARILVVDDQKANVELFLALLRREGYPHVLAAATGAPHMAAVSSRDGKREGSH